MVLIRDMHVSRSKSFRDERARINKLTTFVRNNRTHCAVEEGGRVARTWAKSKVTKTGSQIRSSRGWVVSRWCPRSSNFLQAGNIRQARKTEAGSRFKRTSNGLSESESETERVNKDAAETFLVSSKSEKMLRSRRSALDNVLQ